MSLINPINQVDAVYAKLDFPKTEKNFSCFANELEKFLLDVWTPLHVSYATNLVLVLGKEEDAETTWEELRDLMKGTGFYGKTTLAPHLFSSRPSLMFLGPDKPSWFSVPRAQRMLLSILTERNMTDMSAWAPVARALCWDPSRSRGVEFSVHRYGFNVMDNWMSRTTEIGYFTQLYISTYNDLSIICHRQNAPMVDFYPTWGIPVKAYLPKTYPQFDENHPMEYPNLHRLRNGQHVPPWFQFFNISPPYVPETLRVSLYTCGSVLGQITDDTITTPDIWSPFGERPLSFDSFMTNVTQSLCRGAPPSPRHRDVINRSMQGCLKPFMSTSVSAGQHNKHLENRIARMAETGTTFCWVNLTHSSAHIQESLSEDARTNVDKGAFCMTGHGVRVGDWVVAIPGCSPLVVLRATPWVRRLKAGTEGANGASARFMVVSQAVMPLFMEGDAWIGVDEVDVDEFDKIEII